MNDRVMMPNQIAIINLKKRIALYLVEQILDIADEKVLEELSQNIRNLTKNSDMYEKIINILNIEDPLDKYDSISDIENTQEYIVSEIRKFFMSGEERDKRYSLNEGDLDVIQEMLNDQGFRLPDNNARDYEKMIRFLTKDSERRISSDSLVRFISKYKKLGMLKENLKFIPGTTNPFIGKTGSEDIDEDGVELLKILLNDPEYRKDRNNARDYVKILEALRLKGYIIEGEERLKRLISTLKSNGSIEDEISFENIGKELVLEPYLKDIERMLNDMSFRNQETKSRNYEAIINALGVKVSETTLKRFISAKLKSEEIVETIKFTPNNLNKPKDNN